MSNPFAVAAVTTTFSQLLAGVNAEPTLAGTTVSTRSIDLARSDYSGGRQLNLFLYGMSANSGWRTMELPARNAAGSLVNQPVLALDLHYLLTTFGQNDDDVDAQHLLAHAMSIIHDQPVFTRDQIRAATQAHTAVQGSDLADQVELIKICPREMTEDDLFKLWSTFQTPYRLSVAYEASVVLIERPQPVRTVLPVRAPNIVALPALWPAIETLSPQAVAPGDILTIQGNNLRGSAPGTPSVLFGGVAAPAGAVQSASDRQIQVAIPSAGLHAGITSVQVVQQAVAGSAQSIGMSSNVAALAVRPRIALSSPGPQPGTALVSLSLQVSPSVGPLQSATLLLNALPSSISAAPGSALASHSFPAAARTADSGVLTVPISGVQPGRYLVRLSVDGVQSLLEVDPSTGQYVGPTVAIP